MANPSCGAAVVADYVRHDTTRRGFRLKRFAVVSFGRARQFFRRQFLFIFFLIVHLYYRMVRAVILAALPALPVYYTVIRKRKLRRARKRNCFAHRKM